MYSLHSQDDTNPWNLPGYSEDSERIGQTRDMIISPSPPPPRPDPMHTAQTPAQGQDSTDPHIASLKAIFPDFDDAVILSVLESTHNDHDRALDVLLGMNDPSFVPPEPAPQQSLSNQSLSAPLSQEALDEQLARRLALEEEQAAVAAAAQPRSALGTGPQGPSMYQPYQPGGRHGWTSQTPDRQQVQGQGGYSMAEFQEGFNRFAESGKKTFSSIVSKVKAKMQEFDQGQGWSGSPNANANQPRPASGSSYTPGSFYTPGQQRDSAQAAFTQPYVSSAQHASSNSSWPARTSTYQPSPPRSGVLRPTVPESTAAAPSQEPFYYDPNSRGYDLYEDGEEESRVVVDKTGASSAAASLAATSISVRNPTPTTPPHSDELSSPSTLSDTHSPPLYVSPVSSNPRLSSSSPVRDSTPTTTTTPSPAGGGVRSTTPGAPGSVDFSKLGLLPKRPVSLVRPHSPPVAAPMRREGTYSKSESMTQSSTDGESEEPEYVKNPFEDEQ